MGAPRDIAVVTGSRADHGPLRPLIRGLRDDRRFRPLIVACGGHLDPRQGGDLAVFESDGIAVAAAVDLEFGGTSPNDVAAAAGRAVAGLGTALADLGPDLILLLGDRYEVLAAAMAAHLLRLPIVHLSGGDVTEGSLDDAMRHAVSKLAHLHLPSNEDSARRLRALGEPPERIFTVGSTALDGLMAFIPLDRAALERRLDAELRSTVIAVAYHSATLADEDPAATLMLILEAVRACAPDASVIVTGTNADAGGAEIDAAARRAADEDERIRTIPSLGQEGFWSLLHHADALVGNSSAALIEAPLIGVPVVDVGVRQAGRLRSPRTIHAEATPEDLRTAVAAALARSRRPHASPYGDGRAVPRALDVIAGVREPRSLLRKPPPEMSISISEESTTGTVPQ